MKLPQTRIEWLVITLLAGVLGVLWIGATRVAAEDVNPNGKTPSADIEHPAPDFSLTTLDGSTASLSDYRGKPVILNFWATWCGPCRVEIPALEAAWQNHQGEAVFLGVDVQEDPLQVADFAQQLGMTYPVLLDETAETAQLYRVRAFPTTVFIDGQGVVIDIYTGPLNEPLLATRVQQLLETSQ